ncbi:MAG: ATP-binding cassette domain-containing protein, partial [Lachnospiraceae bacterium]|nr:ATP-binding cassette domain-containing protein [Lachnospiraceae bacterium]
RRDKIGFVFQDYNLIPVFSVYENVVLPIQLGGHKEDREYVEKVLKELGIEDVKDRNVTKLSGGQRQRVAIARAIVSNPAIILADEPTGNLDSESTEDVMTLLNKAVKEFGRTVVMITHNESLLKNCDRVFVIKDGVLNERK